MNRDQIDQTLRLTWEDERFTRSERRELRELLGEKQITDEERQFWRHRAFALATEQLSETDPRRVVEWLESVIKALQAPPVSLPYVESSFSPGDTCRMRIIHYLTQAKKTVDICVFTITDDRITAAIIDAHRRGVPVRVISDNDKSEDRGSDVESMTRAGVQVRLDRSPHHMHHKYAIFDGQFLLNGSFNWTRSASRHNAENILVTDERRLVRSFSAHFDRSWTELDS